jgi:ABC-2 type transport system permease protein
VNSTIFWLTLRQLLGRRRIALVILLVALPALVAIVYRLGSQDTAAEKWTANTLMDGLIVTTLLPLVALIFGTAALGAEIEDGTAVYLLSKPVSRRTVIASKLLPAWLLTVALVAGSAAISGIIALGGSDDQAVVRGFIAALVLGSFAYTALFVLLSVTISRALIAGLVYVFVWEGVVTQLFSGTRFLSIRQYSLGVADLFSRASSQTFAPELGGTVSLVLIIGVSAAAVAFAIWRLQSFEIGESA